MRLLEPFVRYKVAKYLMTKSDLRQETSRTADLGWDTHLTQNDTGRRQSTRQIATRSVHSFLHRDQVISRVGMSASCLVTMSTVHGCDRQTWRWKTRCSTEVAQRKMNRPINSGKRVDGVHRFSAESSRSTESTKVESIDFQSSWVDLFDSIDFKVYWAYPFLLFSLPLFLSSPVSCCSVL